MAATVTITTPLTRSVLQRDGSNNATMSITGTVTGLIDQLEIQLVPQAGMQGVLSPLIQLPIVSGAFSHSMTVPKGGYNLNVVGYQGYYPLAVSTQPLVGVGDMILAFGQSNGTNNDGTTPTSPVSDWVQAWNPDLTWAAANDPQPVGDGAVASIWPSFGDQLVAITGCPVGIVTVGVGGTEILQWTPSNATLWTSNLLPALMRAGANYRMCCPIIGESDASDSTTQVDYYNRMKEIVDATIAILPNMLFAMPVTETWWHSLTSTGAGVRAAQLQISTYTSCFAAADPDTLDNSYRNADQVHFSQTGLVNHAALWVAAFIAQFGA